MGSLVTLLVIIGIVGFFIDEPLRRYMERNLNEKLQGYTVRLEGLDFHVFGFSLDLEDMVIVQKAHPDPPVARLPFLSASVQWRELLSLRLVADFLIDHPTVHLNFNQAETEAKDKVPVHERGWQDALQAIYPLKINELRIVEGKVTYVAKGRFEPLRLSRLNFLAGNIRNIHAPENSYPSHVSFEGIVFDSGTVRIDGHADFLAEPHIGIKARCALEKIALEYFKPMVDHYNIALRKGAFSGAGDIEYAPHTKVVHLQKMTIQGVQVDYIHKPETAAAEKQTVQKVKQTAKNVSNDPQVLLRVDELHIIKSNIGFVNKAADPDYRVFLNDTKLHLTNFSNQQSKDAAVAKLTGQFMGSGDTKVDAKFRPEKKGPNFDLAVRIEGTQMPAMNDLLRASGNFDVVAGIFSFYSELSVKDGTISGYVKPLFKDLNVYDRRQDKEKNLFHEVYEGVIGGVASLLENQSRDEVATKTEVSGRVGDPNTNTWQIIIRLIQNAFFKAILPGFEQEVTQASRG